MTPSDHRPHDEDEDKPKDASASSSGLRPAAPALPKLSRASKDRPVPMPMRPVTPAPARPPANERTLGSLQSGNIGSTKPTLSGPPRSPTSPGMKQHSPRPGFTQAIRVGPGEGGAKAPLTTHANRGQDRVPMKQEIELSYTFALHGMKEAMPAVYRGRLVDISLGGAQIEGPVPPHISPKDLTSDSVVLDADIALPFVQEPLLVSCNVTWTKPAVGERYFIGLRFFNMSQQQANTVRAFLIGLQSPAKSKFRRPR